MESCMMKPDKGRSESTESHRAAAEIAAAGKVINCAVLTISDTRTKETDAGGGLIREMLMGDVESNFAIADHEIVKDDAAQIGDQIDRWTASPDIHVILATGGTGISRRDTTIEVVRGKLTAELPGFGELFRMLSWEEVGAAAMLSRAVGGLVAGDRIDENDQPETFIFAMPGSVNAVRLAMSKLILPELPHLLWERK